MDFKAIINKIASMDDAVEAVKAPELPKAVKLNEDAELRVLSGRTTYVAEAKKKAEEEKVDEDAFTDKPKEKEMKVGDKRKTASGGTVTKTATGVIHKGSRYGGSTEDEKKSKKDESIDVEAFKGKFSKMVEAKKKAKPDFLDIDGDGDKKEPMKKAAADKKKVGSKKKKVDEAQLDELSPDTLQSYKKKTDKDMYKSVDPTLKGKEKDDAVRKDRNQRVGRDRADSKLIKKSLDGAFESKQGSKKTVKESVESKLTFKQMIQLVQESGGQQQIDPVDQELFAWATRVARTKMGEGMKAEVYAGLIYERMGGVFEMYDVLSEDKE